VENCLRSLERRIINASGRPQGEHGKIGHVIYGVPAEWARSAHADAAKYDSMYASSASTPDAFWAEHGKRIDWIKPFTKEEHVLRAGQGLDQMV
jgi:Domain of unknown function (DUF3448).